MKTPPLLRNFQRPGRRPKINFNAAKNIPMTDPVGTLEKALERNLWAPSMTVQCLCWTSHLVKTSMSHPIPTKSAFQGVGSVPAGSAQH